MKLINIGCGTTFHPEWVNIDVEPVSRNIIRHDAGTPFPFEDGMFDACYCSHVLEHFSCDVAQQFLSEMHRVLKTGGVIRLLVPDLEQIAKLYLHKLFTVNESEADYDWIMLELYDQCVREKSGGLMERYLRRANDGLSPFVAARIGASNIQYREQKIREKVFNKLSWRNLAHLMYKLRLEFAKWTVFAVAGKKGKEAFIEGLFRNSGEIHRWMYDRFSLGRLMTNTGFVDIRVVSPHESRIQDFARYNLDVSDGVVRKPDSLAMEGIKP